MLALPLPPLPVPHAHVPYSGGVKPDLRALHAHLTLNRYYENLALPVSAKGDTGRAQSLVVPTAVAIQASALAEPTVADIAGLRPVRVGIIGGGAAGLYAAYILQHILSKSESGITYEVLEADPKRVGSRIYTHHFAGGKINDYYDVGAMRFPRGIPSMCRVFDLFKMLGIETMDYVMSIPQNLNFFNGKLLTNAQLDKAGADPFHTGVAGVTCSVNTLVDQQLGRFKNALKDDFDAGWKELMKYDDYSTRTYMVFQGTGKRYNPEVVNYLETFDSATNLYDQALTETVMDSLDFDYPDTDVQWKCIHGGAQQIADKMTEALRPLSVQLGQRVIAIKPENRTISVTIGDEAQDVRRYDHVITTVPFSCLRAMDTSGCDFPWELQSAMRMLHYDASTKAAIQFCSRWWEVECNQRGGVSRTDRPTRVIVYPSYGIGEENGATMIVSYTWSQDALREGAFLGGEPGAKGHLIDIILKDLADMHGVPLATLKGLVVDSHVYGWYNNEFSGGAFALFGPGQFTSLYPKVTSPSCNGMLHFAGEATSVHHAWLVGALNSGYRTIYEILRHEGRSDLIKIMQDKFGPLGELSAQQRGHGSTGPTGFEPNPNNQVSSIIIEFAVKV